MKRLSVFGATGSIGQSTLDLVRRNKDLYCVKVLTGGRNLDCLVRNALEFRPEFVVTAHDDCYQELNEMLSHTDIKVAAGANGINEAASVQVNWAMSAIVGAAGLEPGLRAMQAGADLALANKESMVAAGALMRQTSRENDVALLPVDSEHSGVFQALIGEDRKAVERVILTASGGAFRDWSLEEIAAATPEQAATHPNWDMGQRVTIDSASLFNKALEVIEAKELFDLKPKQVEVLVHPQSMIHALVGFQDGGLMAHIGPADMRHAIGFALNYPDRSHLPVERLDLAKIGRFDFSAPDLEKYPALRLAYDVLDLGGFSGAVYNAAKEIVLDAFIAHRIGFLDMAKIVEAVLERIFVKNISKENNFCLENILNMDHIGRTYAREEIEKNSEYL
jgi:1-deoxy-D-xylulose-5-phosphate reductoisomerase